MIFKLFEFGFTSNYLGGSGLSTFSLQIYRLGPSDSNGSFKHIILYHWMVPVTYRQAKVVFKNFSKSIQKH